MQCIADEAGRLWVAGCSEQERGWVPRREHESWLCLMREAELLRLALSFGRAHASIPVSEDAGRFQLADGGEQACDAIEASFCAIYGGIRQRHIVRRGPTERGGYAPDVDGHCFYCTGSGQRLPGYRGWEGRQSAREQGDRIGMLLDLDQGSITVWKNDEQLGVMVAEGLRGPLCWAVSMFRQADGARAAAAKAWESESDDEKLHPVPLELRPAYAPTSAARCANSRSSSARCSSAPTSTDTALKANPNSSLRNVPGSEGLVWIARHSLPIFHFTSLAGERVRRLLLCDDGTSLPPFVPLLQSSSFEIHNPSF